MTNEYIGVPLLVIRSSHVPVRLHKTVGIEQYRHFCAWTLILVSLQGFNMLCGSSFVRLWRLLFAVVALIFPSLCYAHIELIDPPPRYGKDFQKHAPCGHPNNGSGAGKRTRYLPGETTVIQFDEFIDHRSHFRISLSVDGDKDLVDPSGFDDLYVNEAVLLDGIIDNGEGPRSIEVTFPHIECRRCTLQLMQVMYEGEFDPERSLYYQCADIALGQGEEPNSNDSSSGSETAEEDSEGALDDVDTSKGSNDGCKVESEHQSHSMPIMSILVTIVFLFRRRQLACEAIGNREG